MPDLNLTLQRELLTNDADVAGIWQYEGGKVFKDGQQIAWYSSIKRTISQVTDVQNTAALTLSLFFLGSSPPDTITLQGAHSFNTGNQSGSVSAASKGLRIYIGADFSRTGDILIIHATSVPENTLQYLDSKVTIGSAPAWLVTRYAVECTYRTPNGIRNCGNKVYGPEGGITEGQISNEGGAFPLTIQVTVTIDFEPQSGLTGLVKNFSPDVTDTGVNFLFEPYQVLQTMGLLLDLQPSPLRTDYVSLRWKHNVGETVIASGKKYLSGDELREQPVTQYEIVFMPDPIYAKDMSLVIEGRYQDQILAGFAQTFELSERAVLLRTKEAASGEGYMLVVV